MKRVPAFTLRSMRVRSILFAPRLMVIVARVTEEHLCCSSSMAWRLWLPEAVLFDECVGKDHQLSHDGGEGDLGLFAGSSQASTPIRGQCSTPIDRWSFTIDPESPAHKSEFNQDKTYVFSCASGARSALAALVAMEMGRLPAMRRL